MHVSFHFDPLSNQTAKKGEGVISDHKYSGHNNSVRVEFCSRQRVVSATFWFTNEGKVFFCFCFNYDMF